MATYMAINPDGSIKWTLKLGSADSAFSSPAIGPDGTIYIVSIDIIYPWFSPENMDYYLHAVDSNGHQKWEYYLGRGDVEWYAPPSPVVGADGSIYVGSRVGWLYALTPEGSLKWKFSVGDDYISSPLMGSDGTLYVGTSNNTIYALDPNNGSIKWSLSPETYGWISCEVIGSDGILYATCEDGYLYAIDSNTHSIKWYFSVDSVLDDVIIGSNNTLYAGGAVDGYLYSIGQSESELVAEFTADQTEGTCPLTVKFTDQSTGEITSWFWDFGDGETSTEQNPTHMYCSTGYFTVSLTVTGPGGSDTETKEDYIHVTPDFDKCYVNCFKIVNPLVPETEGEIRVVLSAGCDNKRGLRLRIGDLMMNSPIDEGNRTYLFSFDIPDEWVNSLQEAELTVDIPLPPDYHYKQDLVIEEEAQGFIKNLIYDYAPILKFAKEEEYFPVRVEMVFEEATYKSNDGFPEIKVTKDLLAKRGSKEAKIKVSGKDINGNIEDSVIYATCKKQGNRLAVQYWFHYTYDSKTYVPIVTSHNGDWEMITIVFDVFDENNYVPLYVAFSEHRPRQTIECISGECINKLGGVKWKSGGIRIPWDKVDKDGTHPIVYVAMGSHASYPYAGEWSVSVLNYLYREVANGKLGEWKPDPYLSNVISLPRLSEITSTHDYGWLLFSGVYYNDLIPLGLENDEEGKEKAKLIDMHNIKFPPYQEEKWLKPIDWAESLCSPFNIEPKVDIKVNGKDGPIILTRGDSLVINLTVSNMKCIVEADFWLWAEAPNGRTYWYDPYYPVWWRPSTTPLVSYQGSISNGWKYPIYHPYPFLLFCPVGTYTLHFAVDLNKNGQLDDERYEDIAIVNIIDQEGR